MYLIHQRQKNLVYLEKYKLRFFCFKQLPLNTKQKFEFLYHLIDGERLLPAVVGVVIFSADKPLDVHDTFFPVSPSLFKV